jgi:RNA polymerase sigma-70 factor (ECF subfamily)
LLRHYFIDHMTIDELSVLHRVHRATAARWINDMRAELIAAVRRALVAQLPANDVGLRSIIELVASQLDLSLERIVGPDAD